MFFFHLDKADHHRAACRIHWDYPHISLLLHYSFFFSTFFFFFVGCCSTA